MSTSVTSGSGSRAILRPEAVAHRERGQALGYLIGYERRWSRRMYSVLLAAAAAMVIFVCSARVHEYASGPAVVRVDGRRTVTATAAGSVDAVLVQPGQHVKKDDVLVRFRDVEQAAELQRVSTQFELELVRLLRDPTDVAAKQSLGALKVQGDLARTLLADRVVRAPFDGIVSDIRVRPGQHLAAGDAVLGIAPEGASVYLVAIVPADYRPMLASGLAMRFSLDGYKYEYHDLVVESLGEEAVGPSEIKRYLGQELFDAVHLDSAGAQVLVRAQLPARTFTSEGKAYTYSDGLTGLGEVRVRSEPLIVTLLPALKVLLP